MYYLLMDGAFEAVILCVPCLLFFTAEVFIECVSLSACLVGSEIWEKVLFCYFVWFVL